MSEHFIESYQEFVKPQLGRLLKILRLDKNFIQAEGDQMMYLSNDQLITVKDFLGGYGSLILGHNPKFILEEIDLFFKAKRVIHAQASVRSETALLGKLLTARIQAELKTRDRFIHTFASTGTEATEIAIKNSLLLWQKRKTGLKRNLLAWFGSLKNDQETQKQYEQIVNQIDLMVPVLISLNRSYHGKTASAVLSSSNDYYKKMYSHFLFEGIFLDVERSMETQIGILERKNYNFEFKGKEFSFSPFIGFIFEPIQGEGGIRPIPKEKLEIIFEFTGKHEIPTIADEIQSGLFRTGYFLACSEWSLQPDIILLGKSLGGGVSKITSVSCREQFYDRELGMIHSSTFAEDDFSSRMALKTIEYLESQKDDICKRANRFESDIRSFFSDLKKKYPRWIKDIRGKGFLMGVEFNFIENENIPTLLYSLARNGHASYLLTSFLLNRHQIRVGVTLSSPETIRIQPCAYVTDQAIQQLKKAFENLLFILDTNSLGQLFSHIFSKDEIIPDRLPLVQKPLLKAEKIKDVAFIGHIINWDHAQRLDPSLRGVKLERLKKFFTAYGEFSRPFRYHQQIIESVDGKRVRLSLYGLTVVSEFIDTPVMVDTLQDFVDELQDEPIEYLGLGQFTSIATKNGTMLNSGRISLTTGNSLTAGFSIEAIENAILSRGLKFENINVGIVGFAGNIGRVITQIMATKGSHLTLVYKEPYASSVRFQNAVTDIVQTTRISRTRLHLTANMNDLKTCDVVVLATSSVQELLHVEHLKQDAVIIDISVPSNVGQTVRASKNFLYVPAGLARLPKAQSIDHSWLPLLSGDCFACLAETLVLGLSDYQGSFSIGDITPEKVQAIRQMANRRGFVVTKL
ncbi:MAG: aminotransferase class III-fold pyridoxal phosphate-dependent enzyme [Bdellovibrionaceae bacterium]|nr:aminotransferase class III-fold pyridoxal phosphate-dependent enzyme [Pseudobdellovibrionaceae bacterium]